VYAGINHDVADWGSYRCALREVFGQRFVAGDEYVALQQFTLAPWVYDVCLSEVGVVCYAEAFGVLEGIGYGAFGFGGGLARGMTGDEQQQNAKP
jgi:hypothetical protein